MRTIFTSESVTSGHPDKICDWIADHILDEALRQDPTSKMAVEATIKDDFILVYGEANTKADIPYAKIAKDVLRKIGYEEEYEVLVKVNKQSMEISNAVDSNILSAGDQGIMFGFACDESKGYMPIAIDTAHMLAKRLEEVRRNNPLLKPDGKTQVSVEYEDDQPIRIDTILVSTQHSADISQEELKKLIIEDVIQPIVNPNLIDDQTKFLINPSGSFVLGGSFGDSGTTGRKIVVDTYGGSAPIGGGCFSSKDPTKVDRSAAYYARYVCKNLVANGFCKKCQIELAYAIGCPEPVSINIDAFNTSKHTNEELLEIVKRNFNFSVSNIIHELDLRKPIYTQTTNYGHFGKPYLPWEQIITIK
ncbi:methionine adenosyltransferase [Anaerorhabdus furcosa]|uniref:Methionine adenosyltransferase n=1 Tax=Anaerorhabdus furcosa TaxID=118967 RepID=A0A1T4PUG6_9FIRM|nr:methionine adenosyltransferase [Anaerorhabdus furcosa]SJZ94897.1 methionine adenosyltransferase [Anaerorhabdus furcosa]